MQKVRCLDGSQLKIIAIILMTIDHIGVIIYPQYTILRIIGRLAFPIFAFLCVEGVLHTKDKNEYMGRLLLFALISEIPYDFVFYGEFLELEHQNIFFTLFIGVVCVDILENSGAIFWKYLWVYFLSLAADMLCVNYGTLGVWIIIGFYLTRTSWWKMLLMLSMINIGLYGGIQGYAVLALIPIMMYDGTRGKGMKYFFYLYYPLHIIVLYMILCYI